MGLAISTLLISFIGAAAHADDVLTLGTGTDIGFTNTIIISTYTFNSSMILNSIGFVTGTSVQCAYSMNGGAYINATSLGPLALGVQYLNLATPITLNATDVVRVSTQRTGGDPNFPALTLRGYTAVPGFNITVVGNDKSQGAKTNSNLRVSALGASVAPEPGTLALALTGGCALLGMYVRRRKAA